MSARLAIATVTLVRDPTEEVLLRRSLQRLVESELPIVIADGGSNAGFVEFLATLDGARIVAPDRKGLVPQVRAALEGAAGDDVDAILYTESDKLAFFDAGLSTLVEQGRVGVDTTLTLASRDAQSFATFPPVQQYTERTINDLCGEALAAPGDYSYGPFVMGRSLVPWLRDVPDDLGWGWRHAIFAIAHRLGHRIVHVAGRFECPLDQREEDEGERLHRLRQLDQNISGLQVGLALTLRVQSPKVPESLSP